MATDGRSEQPGSPALPSTRRLSATGLGLPSSGAPPRPVKQGREPRLPESHRRALSVLVDRLSGADVRWAVTGSVAFALHGLWLITIVVAVPADAALDWLPLSGFMLLQAARVWIIVSLGTFWTTRIVTLPDEPLIRRGPYRFLRHPNYLVVVGEIALLPLAFGAWQIAGLFSLLNLVLLAWRRRVENAALAPRRGLTT